MWCGYMARGVEGQPCFSQCRLCDNTQRPALFCSYQDKLKVFLSDTLWPRKVRRAAAYLELQCASMNDSPIKSLAQRRNRCSTVLVRNDVPAHPNHCTTPPSPRTLRPATGPRGPPLLVVALLHRLSLSTLCPRCPLRLRRQLRSCQPQHNISTSLPANKRSGYPTPRVARTSHPHSSGHTQAARAWRRPEYELSERPREHWHTSGYPSAIAIWLGE